MCVFLEPIALYHTRDLYEDGDELWLATYPDQPAPIGRARTYGDGKDLTILTFGNGVRMSLRVARRLERIDIATRVVDLRWLAPLPVEDMLAKPPPPAEPQSSYFDLKYSRVDPWSDGV